MTFDEYQIASKRTMNPGLGHDEELTNYGLGVAGEAGEVVELVKKHVFHGKPMGVDALEKELGDVLYYVSALATTAGISLTTVAENNVAKLLARYPDGFVVGGGNR